MECTAGFVSRMRQVKSYSLSFWPLPETLTLLRVNCPRGAEKSHFPFLTPTPPFFFRSSFPRSLQPDSEPPFMSQISSPPFFSARPRLNVVLPSMCANCAVHCTWNYRTARFVQSTGGTALLPIRYARRGGGVGGGDIEVPHTHTYGKLGARWPGVGCVSRKYRGKWGFSPSLSPFLLCRTLLYGSREEYRVVKHCFAAHKRKK